MGPHVIVLYYLPENNIIGQTKEEYIHLLYKISSTVLWNVNLTS